MRMFAIFFAGAILIFSLPVRAQDSCGDILRSGVFDSVDWQSRTEFREIVLRRFLSSTYDQSRKSESGIGIQPVGEMIMGSAYDEEAFQSRKRDLSDNYTRVRTDVDEWSHAVRTGNPEIVNAWKECMLRRGGVHARFETASGSGNFVTLVLGYSARNNIDSAFIEYDTLIPSGVTVLNQRQFKQCLGQGARIASGECRVDLQLPANMPLRLTISTDRGDVTAVLARRLRWQVTRRELNFETREQLSESGRPMRGGVIQMPAELVNSGFLILPQTVQISGPFQLTPRTDGTCSEFSRTLGNSSITYSLRIFRTDNRTTDCQILTTLTMQKDEFVPDE